MKNTLELKASKHLDNEPCNFSYPLYNFREIQEAYDDCKSIQNETQNFTHREHIGFCEGSKGRPTFGNGLKNMPTFAWLCQYFFNAYCV